jgi:hypothetical protein
VKEIISGIQIQTHNNQVQLKKKKAEIIAFLVNQDKIMGVFN